MACPVANVVALHLGQHAAHAFALFGLAHGQGLVQRVVERTAAEGVDQHGIFQLHGSARELGQHQHARLALLGGHKFLGHQVQAIAQRRDPGDIGCAVGTHHLFKRQRRGREMNG